jgi:methyl-accepting chemotaxis protein
LLKRLARSHELLGQIAVHAKKQQSESEWIAEGITQLREKTEGNVSHIELAAASTEETAAMMEEYVRHAEQLSERAETLQLLLDRLQTK